MEDINEKKISTKTKLLIIGGIILFIVLCILWARFISTRGIVINEVKVDATTLPDEYDGLKIVHFTDVHYGSTVNKKEMEHIVETINKQNADIVIFTGDLVEQGVQLNENEVNELTDLLNKIDAKIEKYVVKGNHDFDHNYFDNIIPKTNFVLLNNSYDYFYKDSNIPIVIAGLDDYWKGKPDYKSAFSFLQDFEEQPYTILLLHEPDQVDELGEYKFNIAFAGHSHLGQVRLPFLGALYTPYGARKYTDSHYLINGNDLYIDGGLGTSTLKLRFFNKPSISLYRFYTK
jgi:predicted MPP superfamily phosphohydrolase